MMSDSERNENVWEQQTEKAVQLFPLSASSEHRDETGDAV